MGSHAHWQRMKRKYCRIRPSLSQLIVALKGIDHFRHVFRVTRTASKAPGPPESGNRGSLRRFRSAFRVGLPVDRSITSRRCVPQPQIHQSYRPSRAPSQSHSVASPQYQAPNHAGSPDLNTSSEIFKLARRGSPSLVHLLHDDIPCFTSGSYFLFYERSIAISQNRFSKSVHLPQISFQCSSFLGLGGS